MLTRTLVAQAEATKPTSPGRLWFGYEVFEVDGQYRLAIHTSTYDGIKRVNHHVTEETPMAALTREGALSEAARRVAAYAVAIGAQWPPRGH